MDTGRLGRRDVALAFLVLVIVFAPRAAADPQCWDSYSQRELPKCGGNPNSSGPFNVSPGGDGGNDGGGLIGAIGRGLKRLL